MLVTSPRTGMQKIDWKFYITLVREAETVFVDVYSISGMGRMRAQA